MQQMAKSFVWRRLPQIKIVLVAVYDFLRLVDVNRLRVNEGNV